MKEKLLSNLKLEKLWEELPKDLKKCAVAPFPFGLYGKKITLNHVGMTQLVEHLDAYGFDIRKKEENNVKLQE
jgi:hypothetical protein